MISDAIPLSTSDAAHISFADGYVFHVRGGQITAPGEPCPCVGLEAVHQVTAYREAYPQSQLSLTDQCNMACTYCSFRDRVHADGKPVTIPLETVVQGLATHRKRLGEENARYSRIDFGLAGETMLVRHMHEEVQALVEEGLATSPVSVVWAGPMVTNATLSMTAELADRLGPPQDISLDGPKDVHDRVRFYTGDRGGTYDHVRPVLDQVLARHPDMGVSAVLTAYCTDFVAIFRHLFEDVGARNIYMKPVNATHDKDYALNAATLPAFRRGYADLVEHILGQPPEGILARLLALNSEDFFMRYFYRVKDRAAQVYRCGAGKSGTYLDTNGNLYPCAHFIGKSGWHIGHASTGVEDSERSRYLNLVVDDRDGCSTCPSRYVCGGGCYYQAVLANGDITKPDDVKCDLIRFLTDLAVRLVITLREKHPEVLDALPAPYGLTDEALTAPPEADYVPAARLHATSGNEDAVLPLVGPGRLRGGLVNPEGLRARLSLDDGHLAVRLDFGGTPSIVRAVRVRLQPLGSGTFTLHDLAAQQWPGEQQLSCSRDGAQWLQAPTARFRRVPHPDPIWEDAVDVDLSWTPQQVRLTVPLPAQELVAELGVNVFVDFEDGGWTALTLHEPFALLDRSRAGVLRLSGPEAPVHPEAASVNGRMPAGLTPIGRWAGLQGNTC
ncbi:SPASM domain-containing protein [Kitasatospora sp. NPDC048545]|uniref:radical SAM/SPASM domain-containing protein n=1 Tax=Kitasatospora sp. NPDC048545 TaxID=3157208 RepID=UPI0033C684BD